MPWGRTFRRGPGGAADGCYGRAVRASRKTGWHTHHPGSRPTRMGLTFYRHRWPFRSRYCQPRVAYPLGLSSGLVLWDVLLLGIGEAPNFIDLNSLAGQITERPVLVCRASFAPIYQWGSTSSLTSVFLLAPVILARSRQPRFGPDGHALDHRSDDLRAPLGRKPVHDGNIY